MPLHIAKRKSDHGKGNKHSCYEERKNYIYKKGCHENIQEQKIMLQAIGADSQHLSGARGS